MQQIYTLTGDSVWLDRSVEVTEFVMTHYYDRDSSRFWYSWENPSPNIERRTDHFDNAMPSGNSVMAHNLLRGSIYVGRSEWKHLAEKMLIQMLTAIDRYPTSFANWAIALQDTGFGYSELGVVGASYSEQIKEIMQTFLPGLIVVGADINHTETIPLLKDRLGEKESTSFFVCRDFQCELPVFSIEEALSLLGKRQSSEK